MKDTANNALTTGVSLAAYVPLVVNTMSPSSAAVGTQVMFTGQGLDAVNAVAFTNCGIPGAGQDAPAQISAQTPTNLTSNVPPCAGSGAVTLTSTYQPAGVTYNTFSLTPLVWADWLTRGYSPPSLTINVIGGNLDQVTSATVGGVAAPISNQGPYSLTLSVPSTQQGAITLSSVSQSNIASGGVSISNSGATYLYGINFAQVLDEQLMSPHLRLTAGRPALVRAIIGSPTSGNAGPTVQLTATANGTSLGTLSMTGPATLPVGNQTYNQNGTYNAVLPGTWVQTGLTVSINVAPGDGSPALNLQAQPPIANLTKLDLVLVPLIIGGVPSQIPLASQALAALAFTYPYATQDITVTIRATPFTIAGLSSIGTISDFSNVLSQVEQLRQQEAPGKFYFGLVPSGVDNATTGGGKFVGLGHINDPTFPSAQWLTSAIGWDDTNQPNLFPADPYSLPWQNWEITLVHELGHVHSRHHAPCGGAAGPDPSYPYAGGTMGVQPMYASQYTDSTPGVIAEPTTTPGGSVLFNSVMGYCGGAWFSDYDYSFVQAFAESHTVVYPASVTGPLTAAQKIWTYSGTISANGVRLNPVHVSMGIPTPLDGVHGAHVLRLHFQSGGTMDVPLLPIEIGDAEMDQAKAFFVSIPAPGDIQSLEVLYKGNAITATDATGTSLRASVKAVRRQQSISAALAAGHLIVTWDAAKEPYLSVVSVTPEGTRTMIANRLTGGTASVDVSKFSGAGSFEVSTSSELGGTLFTVSGVSK